MVANEPMILSTSPDAAQYTTVAGWVSRDGRFFGEDERTARYSGCTHTACSVCGEPTPKHYLQCESCRGKKRQAVFDAMPRGEWDGDGMLVTFDGDTYFADWEEVEHYCEDHDCTPESLRLVICVPRFAHELDEDNWIDDLPGDEHECPDGLREAIDSFNRVIKQLPALSWHEGDTVAIIPADFARTAEKPHD